MDSYPSKSLIIGKIKYMIYGNLAVNTTNFKSEFFSVLTSIYYL